METAAAIIIGAPRSGTNLLRDLLVSEKGFETWPCDEINYIWRHGNRAWPNDELPARLATSRVVGYIRRRFDRLGNRSGATHVVEKTCANCLRIPFVDQVIPEARYVVIVRDGRDVLLSAIKRWVGRFDPVYVARKARFVPWTDVPYYGVRFLTNRMRRLMSSQRAAPSWGPRFPGMDEIREDRGLEGVVAAQWARCVEEAEDGLTEVGADRICRVRYEDLVRAPAQEMTRIAGFLGVATSPEDWTARVSSVRDTSVGRWTTERDLVASVSDILEPGLQRLRYAIRST